MSKLGIVCIILAVISIVFGSLSIFQKGSIDFMNLVTFLIDGFVLGYWTNEALHDR